MKAEGLFQKTNSFKLERSLEALNGSVPMFNTIIVWYNKSIKIKNNAYTLFFIFSSAYDILKQCSKLNMYRFGRMQCVYVYTVHSIWMAGETAKRLISNKVERTVKNIGKEEANKIRLEYKVKKTRATNIKRTVNAKWGSRYEAICAHRILLYLFTTSTV